jgi:hypothetical protein
MDDSLADTQEGVSNRPRRRTRLAAALLAVLVVVTGLYLGYGILKEQRRQSCIATEQLRFEFGTFTLPEKETGLDALTRRARFAATVDARLDEC